MTRSGVRSSLAPPIRKPASRRTCGLFLGSSPNCGMPDPARSKCAGVHWLRVEPRQCGDRAHRLIPPSMAPTGERRPSMACLHPIPAPPRLSPPECPWLRRCRLRHTKRNVPPKRRTPWSRRTSMQGDFVRADRVCVEPGCTAPACWSRTRNHAADEIPLQRRPPPEAGASALDLQGADPCPLNSEKNLTFPGKVALTPSWWGHERQQASRWGARRPGFPGAFPASSRPDRMGPACTRAGPGL